VPDHEVKKLFIASSATRKGLAEAFARELQDQAGIYDIALEISLWYREAVPGEDILTALTDHCRGNPDAGIEPSDFFAAFLTDDDLRDKGGAGGARASAPSDNVVFELGFFLGGLGFDLRRCFMLCAVPAAALPSDLAGRTYIPFEFPKGKSPNDYDKVAQPLASTVIRRIAALKGVRK